MIRMIYLDYNATAPLRPSVRAAMDAVAVLPLNPSSMHAAGRQAKKLLEDARATIASAMGAFANEVLFVGSGTEANNMVLRGFADRPILVSAIEHASIRKTGSLLGAAEIPVNAQGVVKLDVLEEKLKAFHHNSLSLDERGRSEGSGRDGQQTSLQPSLLKGEGVKGPLVSIMLANNETGVIQPIKAIADIVHAYGGLLHCDAVQALGKIPLDWGLLSADMLTISGHKAGGPVGAAALLIRNDLPIRPLITGGGQELGRRAGTENVAAIVGFAAFVAEVAACPEAKTMGQLRDNLEQSLKAVAVDALVFGGESARLPNTLQISMPGVKSETQLMHFDLNGFAVSAGSACSSGRIEPSAVLLAMGFSKEVAATAIRISLGWATTEEEIHAFAACWAEAYRKLAKPKAA